MQEYREYPTRNRAANVKNNDEEEKGTFFMGKVILAQITVLTLLFLLVFSFCKKGGETYSFLRAFYADIMKNDISVFELYNKAKSTLKSVEIKNADKDNLISTEQSTDSHETEAYGEGGEDLIFPRDNASFSPIYLSMPIFKPVVSDRTTSKFGYRINPVTNEYGFHSGLDIAAPEGTDIFAAFDGVVEKADSSAARGNYIFIKSDGNITTVYCHCSQLLVSEGQSVKAGDVIAKVGSTGQATGPHLHFEIRINGVFYNPLWVLDF